MMDFKMNKDEAMKLALEALENVQYYGWGQTERDYDARTAAITALRKALAEQPAQRKPWVGLTDEEIISMSRYDLEYAALIGEVQRKLKEKNSD